jgi:general secretion pathway protein E/type IV pilus assembly protein PilB
MVLRVLDPASLPLGLPELGFEPDDQRALAQLLQSPDGIVLVTGPTGSGKTTSLYAALHHLNRTDRKIITVEDPVEYQLSGVNQVPVNADIGMTFAAALRALLRQAPNIVMVGEIRDRETAEIALNAALTGHLVFSTLHTNDAPSAVTRLLDIGAKPFLIAAALRAVLGQRLVRRICRDCRRAYTPSPREIYALELTSSQLATAEFACGVGCAACAGTGYSGRLGIFELCQVDDDLRALIYAKAPAIRLRQQARRAGLRSMREDGVRKVLAGLTTIGTWLVTNVWDPVSSFFTSLPGNAFNAVGDILGTIFSGLTDIGGWLNTAEGMNS